MKFQHLVLGFIVAFIWGNNVIAAKIAATAMPPIFSAALRFGLSALIILPFTHRISTPLWKTALIAQFWGACFFACIQTGLALGTTANICVVLQQMAVPFTAIIGMIFLKEPRHMTSIVGIITAIIGIYIMKEAPNVLQNPDGFLFILAGAFFWALSTILIRGCHEKNPTAFVGWMSLFATPTLLLISVSSPWLPILGDELSEIPLIDFTSKEVIFSLGFMAIVATVLANTFWSMLLNYYPAGKVVAFMLFMPVAGIITAHYLLGERFSENGLVGALLILVGMACILFPKAFDSIRKQVVQIVHKG